ncbi:ATP-grasp domain-containing protein [Halobacillus litoralis]|uniref:ATP-grasp domain-containing protein n=1 Tax=Halobacillus litoralis TaxID=45668 RepID=UPI001CD7D20D|nr:ATP-grasp domain-containing protein [Halobacillus litoralis]MCA0971586.1 ATP-grasp domain-containing protein [Halobacillus litoralis]
MTFKVMIVGAGKEQLEIIIKSKARGYYVIAVDGDPSAIGFDFADEHHNISTKDNVRISKLALEKNIDAITYMITETPMRSVREVCDLLNLKGPSDKSVEASVSKSYMRNLFYKGGISSPIYYTLNSVKGISGVLNSENLSFPLVVKPSDAAGQVGISKVNSERELLSAVETALKKSSESNIVIEEFMEGFEVNVILVVQNKEIKFLTISDRVTKPEAFGIALKHVYPSQISYKTYIEIMNMCNKIIDLLEVDTGILYPQIMVTNSGPKVVEIGERIPGGQMKDIFKYATGFNLVDIQLDLVAGNVIRTDRHSASNEAFNAVIIQFLTADPGPLKTGLVKEAKGMNDLDQLVGIIDHDYYLEKDEIRELQTSSDRYYYYTVVGESLTDVSDNSEKAFSVLSFETE